MIAARVRRRFYDRKTGCVDIICLLPPRASKLPQGSFSRQIIGTYNTAEFFHRFGDGGCAPRCCLMYSLSTHTESFIDIAHHPPQAQRNINVDSNYVPITAAALHHDFAGECLRPRRHYWPRGRSISGLTPQALRRRRHAQLADASRRSAPQKAAIPRLLAHFSPPSPIFHFTTTMAPIEDFCGPDRVTALALIFSSHAD